LDENLDDISNLARALGRRDDLNSNFYATVEYALKSKPGKEQIGAILA
jgi:hypothetical protein